MVCFFSPFLVFNHYFNLQWKISKIVGVRIDFNDERKGKRWFKIVNFMLFVTIILIQFVSFITLLLLIYLPGASIEIKIKSVPKAIASFDMLFRVCVLKYYSEEIMKILEDLHGLYEHRSKTDNSYMQGNARKIITYIRYVIISSIVNQTVPLFISVITFLRVGKWFPKFPTEIWLPFDPENYYVPVYIFQVGSFMLFTVFNMSTEPLLFLMLSHISQQFKHLAHDLESFDKKSDLKGVVDKHNLLLG